MHFMLYLSTESTILPPGTKTYTDKFLVTDECMSLWQGFDGEYTATGLPHVTKIPRKACRGCRC